MSLRNSSDCHIGVQKNVPVNKLMKLCWNTTCFKHSHIVTSLIFLLSVTINLPQKSLDRTGSCKIRHLHDKSSLY